MRFLPILLTIYALSACSEQLEHKTWAVVVSIAPYSNPKWHPDELVVTARSQNGKTGTTSVSAARLNCRVGDTIRASVRGLALTLDDRACLR